MKLSLECQTLLPKNHAGGGTADIVYKYKRIMGGIYDEHDLFNRSNINRFYFTQKS